MTIKEYVTKALKEKDDLVIEYTELCCHCGSEFSYGSELLVVQCSTCGQIQPPCSACSVLLGADNIPCSECPFSNIVKEYKEVNENINRVFHMC